MACLFYVRGKNLIASKLLNYEETTMKKYIYLKSDDALLATESALQQPAKGEMQFLGEAATGAQARQVLGHASANTAIRQSDKVEAFLFKAFEREEKCLFLNQYLHCIRELERLEEESTQIQTHLAKKILSDEELFACASGKMVRISSGGLAAIAAVVCQEIVELEQVRQNVISAIQSLADSTLCELLAYRYINGLTGEQIAEKMHYDVRHISRLHKKALVKLTVPLHVIVCPSPSKV